MSIGGNEIRNVFGQLGSAVAAIVEENEELKAKLDTANALVTCCCGSPVDTHGMGDGHSPVDMYHYHHMQLTQQNDEFRELVKILLDNDPGETISDAGHTVLDAWRDNARKLLGVQ